MDDIPEAPDWGPSGGPSVNIPIPSSPHIPPSSTPSPSTPPSSTPSKELPLCSKCGKPIDGAVPHLFTTLPNTLQKGVQAAGKKLHSSCFVCDFCNQSLTGPFYQRYERLFCKNCELKLFGTYCKGCEQPIEGNSLNALNANWHPEHFNCFKCRTCLAHGVFLEKQGRPCCAKCAAST